MKFKFSSKRAVYTASLATFSATVHTKSVTKNGLKFGPHGRETTLEILYKPYGTRERNWTNWSQIHGFEVTPQQNFISPMKNLAKLNFYRGMGDRHNLSSRWSPQALSHPLGPLFRASPSQIVGPYGRTRRSKSARYWKIFCATQKFLSHITKQHD